MREHESLPEMGWEQRSVEECYERVLYLEELINRAPDAQTVRELYQEVIPEIVSKFPYYKQPVHISGFGVHPVFDEDGTTVIGEGWQHSKGTTGMHAGFGVVLDEQNELQQYYVLHKVHIGEARSSPLATVENEANVYKYFTLDSPIVPVIELEAALSTYEFSDTEPGDRLDIVSAYSRDFVNMLRSTTFRRMQHKRQKRVVDEFLLEVEGRASIRDLQLIGELQYGYVPSIQGSVRRFVPISLEEVVINGTCLGIDTVESGKLTEKAIRRDSDLGDKWCGLCIVLDPDVDTRNGLALAEGQVLYIPTFDQSFNAELYESSN